MNAGASRSRLVTDVSRMHRVLASSAQARALSYRPVILQLDMP